MILLGAWYRAKFPPLRFAHNHIIVAKTFAHETFLQARFSILPAKYLPQLYTTIYAAHKYVSRKKKKPFSQQKCLLRSNHMCG